MYEEKKTCPHPSCIGVSFQRPHDKKRHDIGRHKCHFMKCRDMVFPEEDALSKHIAEKHPERPWWLKCGSCSNEHFRRYDKLKKHFLEKHGTAKSIKWNRFQCTEVSCCSEDIEGGIYFPSAATLSEHQSKEHRVHNVAKVQSGNSPSECFLGLLES